MPTDGSGQRQATLRSLLAVLDPGEIAFLKQIAEKLKRKQLVIERDDEGEDDAAPVVGEPRREQQPEPPRDAVTPPRLPQKPLKPPTPPKGW